MVDAVVGIISQLLNTCRGLLVSDYFGQMLTKRGLQPTQMAASLARTADWYLLVIGIVFIVHTSEGSTRRLNSIYQQVGHTREPATNRPHALKH